MNTSQQKQLMELERENATAPATPDPGLSEEEKRRILREAVRGRILGGE